MAQGSSRPKLRPLTTTEPQDSDEAVPTRAVGGHADNEEIKELLLLILRELQAARLGVSPEELD